MAGGSYQMNYNQDFSSISVLSTTGFRLFSISGLDKVDEIFYKENNENIRIVERLFNSSLVVLVTAQKPNCLKMLHFKKKQDICNCVYPSEILCVRMNRHRLIVCLAESIHIHDIRDMKILHSIENIAPNTLGLCSLSLNSHLAFPICSMPGELRIFNASKLKPGLSIKAHNTALSALNFSPSGNLLATASEKGTVIRVFSVKSGQRLQEFRRGVKRCVRIASLVFSSSNDFLCASSNTETVHIFKIDAKTLEAKSTSTAVEPKKLQKSKDDASDKTPLPSSTQTNVGKNEDTVVGGGSWSGYFSKAVSSYLSPVSDVLTQDRAFATAVLSQPGLKHICGLTRFDKQLRLIIACEDGFLYVHEFNAERGGICKLLKVHDLRYALEDVIELNLSESMDQISLKQNIANAKDTANGNSENTCTQDSDKMTNSKEAVNKCIGSVLIENPDPTPDNSYAGILRGEQSANALTDSAKYRKLCDAIDTPTKLYDERQFPPVAIAAQD